MQGEGPPVHTYIFIRLLRAWNRHPKQVVESSSVSTKEGVRWAQQFVGSFVVFGAVTVSSLSRLQELIAGEDCWRRALAPSGRSSSSRRGVFSLHTGVARRTTPWPASGPEGIRRGRAPRPWSKAFTLKINPLKADTATPSGGRSSTTTRLKVWGEGFDILVELADRSLDRLKGLVMAIVGTTPGVASTDCLGRIRHTPAPRTRRDRRSRRGKPNSLSAAEVPRGCEGVGAGIAAVFSSRPSVRRVSILFADLTGYTRLAASLDPEEIYTFLRPTMADCSARLRSSEEPCRR